jgi:hypothetical protein
MANDIKSITQIALGKLDDVYEFTSFSSLSYHLYGQSVDSGFKITAILPHTNKTIDQLQLREHLDRYKSNYLTEIGFQMVVSAFEAWLFDVLRVLLSNPDRLNKRKKIDVSDVLSAASLDDLRRTIVDAELNEIRYKKVQEWFDFLGLFVNLGAPSAHDIQRIAEIKATRDIVVHNSGVANQIYVSKSGALARVAAGQPIALSPEYYNESWKHLRQVVETTGELLHAKVAV